MARPCPRVPSAARAASARCPPFERTLQGGDVGAWILVGEPAFGLTPAPERAQPALPVLGDELRERVHPPAADAAIRESERGSVAIERVNEL